MSHVLDASALLALYRAEPGGEAVLPVLPGSHVSAVNLAEVVGKLGASNLPVIRDDLRGQGVLVHPFTVEDVADCVHFQEGALGLSLGDRVCLALAKRLNATAVTADKAWSKVSGVKVHVIR